MSRVGSVSKVCTGGGFESVHSSVGSGCGWTMPRQEIVLTHSGGRLLMPDCARVRSDGTNELDGIQPDVSIGFRRFDTPSQRARRLEAALPQLSAP